jgi:ABC-2 type transport system permease protein
MRGFWPVFKRELFAFFVTPLAWVLIVVFLVVQGLHFFLLIDHYAGQLEIAGDQSPVQAFFGNTVLLYLILFLLVPPMTMRLFAEERRTGTIETLVTAPVSSSALVLAKYLSALLTYVVMWAPTVLYLVILRRTGDIDWRVAGASYLGVFLAGAGYLALGLLTSALTRSQFLALVLTALFILVMFIVGIAEFVTKDGTFLHAVSSHLSVWSHMNDFSSGLVDSRRVIFYATLTILPLYLTTRVVEAWRT